ncbi:MAG: hypothetical protein JNL42_19120, partial [Anaerolineae bacterium]|nr:hypothetical protein [Anaerolineae bacterium]
LQLGQTGTYTLTVRGNAPASFGTYSFKLWQQDAFGLAFAIQPPASVIAGELFAVYLQVVDPATQDPRPLEGVAITLNLIDDPTGSVIPGFSWSGTTGTGGVLGLPVSVNTPGVYRLRTDASGYTAVDSSAFEVTGISSSGGAFLPDLMLNGEAGGG